VLILPVQSLIQTLVQLFDQLHNRSNMQSFVCVRSVCPENFTTLVGSNTCYQAILKAVSWTAAGQLCNALVSGSYSAIITSSAESSAVDKYLALQIAGQILLRNYNTNST